MKRNSFTLVELLVVIAIIAILAGALAPALMKAWSKSYVDQAKTEIAGFASIGTMIKLDTGYYVRLRDYDKIDTAADVADIYVYTLTSATATSQNNGAPPYFDDTKWDGPYHTYQSGKTVSTTDHTPLDPWGNAYKLEYSTSEKVMVIYSNGPKGDDETDEGATTAVGDDLIYKFK